eukprot:403366692
MGKDKQKDKKQSKNDNKSTKDSQTQNSKVIQKQEKLKCQKVSSKRVSKEVEGSKSEIQNESHNQDIANKQLEDDFADHRENPMLDDSIQTERPSQILSNQEKPQTSLDNQDHDQAMIDETSDTDSDQNFKYGKTGGGCSVASYIKKGLENQQQQKEFALQQKLQRKTASLSNDMTSTSNFQNDLSSSISNNLKTNFVNESYAQNTAIKTNTSYHNISAEALQTSKLSTLQQTQLLLGVGQMDLPSESTINHTQDSQLSQQTKAQLRFFKPNPLKPQTLPLTPQILEKEHKMHQLAPHSLIGEQQIQYQQQQFLQQQSIINNMIQQRQCQNPNQEINPYNFTHEQLKHHNNQNFYNGYQSEFSLQPETEAGGITPIRFKVFIQIEDTGDKYEVWIDKQKHENLTQFYNYLSNELDIANPELFQFSTEKLPSQVIYELSQMKKNECYILSKRQKPGRGSGRKKKDLQINTVQDFKPKKIISQQQQQFNLQNPMQFINQFSTNPNYQCYLDPQLMNQLKPEFCQQIQEVMQQQQQPREKRKRGKPSKKLSLFVNQNKALHKTTESIDLQEHDQINENLQQYQFQEFQNYMISDKPFKIERKPCRQLPRDPNDSYNDYDEEQYISEDEYQQFNCGMNQGYQLNREQQLQLEGLLNAHPIKIEGDSQNPQVNFEDHRLQRGMQNPLMNQFNDSYANPEMQDMGKLIDRIKESNRQAQQNFNQTETNSLPQIKLEIESQSKILSKREIINRIIGNAQLDFRPLVSNNQAFQANCMLSNDPKLDQMWANMDFQHTRLNKLDHFIPQADWVPRPVLHRELAAARGMYERGENMMVQMPDFVDFANELQGYTSRNKLIFQMKRMMLSRGIRANLQMSSTGEVKSITIVVMCSRGGKAHTKNPSIKSHCPFVMYIMRRSAYENEQKIAENPGQVHKKRKKRNVQCDLSLEKSDDETNTNDQKDFQKAQQQNKPQRSSKEDEQDDEDYFQSNDNNEAKDDQNKNDIFGSGRDQADFISSLNQQKPFNKFSQLLEDIDILDDPFFLHRYRSFHNHELDTNMIENWGTILEKDIHRKGAVNILDQTHKAIQELCAFRRKDMQPVFKNQESLMDQLEPRTIRKIDDMEGQEAAFIIVDLSIEDEDSILNFPDQNNPENFGNIKSKSHYQGIQAWPPSDISVTIVREKIMRLYDKVLSQVSERVLQGTYTLEKWRRILKNTKPKVYKKPGEESVISQQQHIQNVKRRRLNNNLERIVSKFQAPVKTSKNKERSKPSKDNSSRNKNPHGLLTNMNDGLINSDDEEMTEKTNLNLPLTSAFRRHQISNSEQSTILQPEEENTYSIY